MPKGTLNDVAWHRILAEPGIRSSLASEGYAFVDAAQMKKLSGREPRLLNKHDYSASRPEIFIKHDLSILPVRRDRYLVGRFNLYQPFPEVQGVTRTLQMPSGIESLDFQALTSEALALSAAHLAGIIDHFIGGAPLRPTVSGRMSTGSFPVILRDLQLSLDVDRAQMELDAGYESEEALVLVEAKNRLSTDFNIRQLYFPFRRFSASVHKPVIPVYLVFSNDVFHLYRYEFTDPEDFRSIQVTDCARYVLGGSSLTPRSILALLRRTAVEPEPAIPFPQADSFARIISLCEHLPLSKEEIHQLYGFTPRQADYYVNAARYLGLVEAGAVERLSPVGRSVLGIRGRDARNLAFIEVLGRRQVFHAALTSALESGQAPTLEEASGLIAAAQQDLSQHTLRRRASTVIAWTQWAVDLTRQALC